MAAPNLANTTSIYGKTIGVVIGTTANTVVLTCPADKVLKINTLVLYSTNTGNHQVDFYDSSETTAYTIYDGNWHISDTDNFPVPHPYPVIDKDRYIYLEEGDEIRIWADGASGTKRAVISYEEIDDA